MIRDSVMSGTYGALGTTEQSVDDFQDVSISHEGEPSVEIPMNSANDEFVCVEVRSSSHLRPVVKPSDYWACVNVTSQRNQQSSTPSCG